MRTITVEFVASAYASFTTYHLRAYDGEKTIGVLPYSCGSLIAYLINTYGLDFEVTKDGFGYRVRVPDNLSLAIRYLAAFNKASLKELNEIVQTGSTKLHQFLDEIGVCVPAGKIPPTHISCGDIQVDLMHFPFVQLCFTLGKPVGFDRVEFDARRIDASFIRRVLRGGMTEEEAKALGAIFMMGSQTQRKYVEKLSKGELSLDDVAKALFRSALRVESKHVLETACGWLKDNGYEELASRLIVERTLL